MADTVTKARRSEIMRSIRSKDTQPERIVRESLRKMGLTGYRLNRKDIIGKPDIAFMSRRIAIFVHGCYWHGHSHRGVRRLPKTTRRYWEKKIDDNRHRDLRTRAALSKQGWTSIIIWECETTASEKLERKIARALSSNHATAINSIRRARKGRPPSTNAQR
jgi:DNA mismatch endonuclease (patch repair protein)